MLTHVCFQAQAIAAGINSAADELEKGVNDNLRLFSLDGNKYAPPHCSTGRLLVVLTRRCSAAGFNTKNAGRRSPRPILTTIRFVCKEEFLSTFSPDQLTVSPSVNSRPQKVTTFSRGPTKMLAVGSTNSQLSLLSYPDLRDVCPTLDYSGEEIFDADFSDDGEMVRRSPPHRKLTSLIRNMHPSARRNVFGQTLHLADQSGGFFGRAGTAAGHRTASSEARTRLHLPRSQVRDGITAFRAETTS